MKKLMFATLMMIFSLAFAAVAFSGPQSDAMSGQMKCPKMMQMKDCPMPAAKLQQMQTGVEKMKTLRQKMLATADPAAKKALMQQHLAEMESCMKMLPAACGTNGCCAQMKKCAKMGQSGKMAGHGQMMPGCQCPQMTQAMMREMVLSLKAQMKMMD